MKRRGLFCGSFDPFTIGHKNIVDRALALCDELIIGIGINQTKKYSQCAEKRSDTIKKIFEGNRQITVKTYEDLTIDFAKRENVDFIVKGVRNKDDFEYEYQQAIFNKEKGNIETMLLCADQKLADVSSTRVRELLNKGENCNDFLPV